MLDVTDLSPLEVIYLIGLLLLFLSAFIYAVYPLFCNSTSPLDDIFSMPEEHCFVCGEHGQCAMRCSACFECMPDLPYCTMTDGGGEATNDDMMVVTPVDDGNYHENPTTPSQQLQSQPEPQPPQQLASRRRVLGKKNSVVEEDSEDTPTALENSVVDPDV